MFDLNFSLLQTLRQYNEALTFETVDKILRGKGTI